MGTSRTKALLSAVHNSLLLLSSELAKVGGAGVCQAKVLPGNTHVALEAAFSESCVKVADEPKLTLSVCELIPTSTLVVWRPSVDVWFSMNLSLSFSFIYRYLASSAVVPVQDSTS